MSTVQGLHTRVNLKNGDVFYGIATQVDDDGSISLENARRCFTSGRVSEYAFMKVPGHIVSDYHPTANEQQQHTPYVETTTQTSHAAVHNQEPPPRAPPPVLSPTQPPQLSTPDTAEGTFGHRLPPVPVSDFHDNSSNSFLASPPPPPDQKNTFVDPAIISISAVDTQEKKSGSEKRSSKKQGKSIKGKKNTETPQSTHPDALEPSAVPTTSSSKPQKSKRGNKAKQQQQGTGAPPTEKADGSAKSAKSPPKSKNAKKQASKKQQQHQQPLEQEQEPYQQVQQPPTKKPQQPLQQHVMPHFGRTNVPRKLVDTVVYDDFNDFLDMSGPGHSIGKDDFGSTHGKNKDQTIQEGGNHQAPVITSSFTAQDTNGAPSQLHKPDDAVNQVATQSLLSSLNMIPTAAFAKSLAAAASPASSVTSDRSHATSYTSPIQKISTQGIKSSEEGGGATPTKTLVPVLPASSPHNTTQSSSPIERLQKPMEHDHTEPVITNGNHANAYDGPVIKSVATGAVCPVLSVQSLARVIQITKSEAGLTDAMLIENAAHAATSITFKVIGGQRRVQQQNHNDAPIVVILAGDHAVGSYGLATARHLANRGIQVVVLLANADGPIIKEQKRCAQFAGVTFVDGVDELPDPLTAPVDLIVDALMGSSAVKKNPMPLLWQAIDWANGNKAPVLSLEYPSGVNSEDGHPFHVMHYILPKWTLCFGAPIQGCISDKVTGGLFVADLGIPAVAWQRIGVKKRGLPWGTESVMPLEYE